MWQGALRPLPHALIPPRRKQRGSLRSCCKIRQASRLINK